MAADNVAATNDQRTKGRSVRSSRNEVGLTAVQLATKSTRQEWFAFVYRIAVDYGRTILNYVQRRLNSEFRSNWISLCRLASFLHSRLVYLLLRWQFATRLSSAFVDSIRHFQATLFLDIRLSPITYYLSSQSIEKYVCSCRQLQRYFISLCTQSKGTIVETIIIGWIIDVGLISTECRKIWDRFHG